MKNALFNKIQITRPKSNVFDLSHEKKLSCNMGQLVPIYMDHVVPGDRFRIRNEALVKLAPLTAPMMHRVNVFTHYFFVPTRLIYDKWADFITGGEDGKATPGFPKVTFDDTTKYGNTIGTLADYLGLPTVDIADTVANPMIVSALPFRAYQLIFNEYYRDQNLVQKVPLTKNETVDIVEFNQITQLRVRAWEKDYLTSGLPFAQKGDPIGIPNQINYSEYATILPGSPASENLSKDQANRLTLPSSEVQAIHNIDSTEILVNDLRRAVRLQEWLEKNARAGSRYVEQILSHFGVKSSDARLQRPEYIGGSKNAVQISEVLSSFNNETVPGAEMYGHGLSAAGGSICNKFFEEHGIVLGILSVLPRTAYTQGIERSWIKFDKFDYYWPEFAHLGEQEVQNQEVYMDFAGDPLVKDDTFAYQSRYAEYKFKNSTVHGQFRDTLDHWHMARKFTAQPALNESFIQCDATHRVFADTDVANHKLYVQLYNDVRAIRPMPVFGTPML